MPSASTSPTFRDLFARDPEASAAAPGRVNLIGEHTDYHEGYVLPTIIPQRTIVHGRRRHDAIVRVSSDAMPAAMLEFQIGAEQRSRGWIDYVQGVTATLGARGHRIGGMDVAIASEVPVGAGVSSSAALAVALLRLVRELWALHVDDVEIARIAQASETEFVGAPVGIMDPMACSLGVAGEALFLDTRTLRHEHVPIPATAEVVVIDSGQRHHHASGHYATRRQESFAAASRLRVSHLRDADLTMLSGAGLEPLLERRARHVISENARVIEAAAAIAAGEVRRAGALFNASHASMRDDYEVSTPEIDVLVDIAQAHPAVYGARMTGGGFGGAVVLLVAAGGTDAGSAIVVEYERRTGLRGVALMPPN
jgi:galactokinase